MNWSDLPLNPSKRTLRQFAAAWIVFFGAFAAVQEFVRHHHVVAMIFGCAALTVGPMGLIRPAMIRPIFVGWSVAAFPIGWLVSRIVLAGLFFLLFTPLAFVFKLIGRDSLHRRFNDRAESYWQPRPSSSDLRTYFQQS